MNFKRVIFNTIISIIIAEILLLLKVNVYLASILTYGIANTFGHFEGEMHWFE